MATDTWLDVQWTQDKARGFWQPGVYNQVRCDVAGTVGAWVNLTSDWGRAYAILALVHYRPGVGDIEGRDFVGSGTHSGFWRQMQAHWVYNMQVNDTLRVRFYAGWNLDPHVVLDSRSSFLVASIGA